MRLPIDTYWMMEPAAGRSLRDRFAACDLREWLAARGSRLAEENPHAPDARRRTQAASPSQGPAADVADRDMLPLTMAGSVAVVSIDGPMVKDAGFWGGLFGLCSSLRVQRAVEAAAADPEVSHILLRVDSPGGSVDGLAALGDAIFKARSAKSVIGQIDGLCASAGYYAISQCSEIYAGRTDLVGSIGTIMMLYDDSEYFNDLGIEAVPIASSKLKAAGYPGVPLTDEMKTEFRKMMQFYFDDFKATIQRGRGMNDAQVGAVATAKIWNAPEAMDLKLIDGIATTDETLARIQAKVAQSGRAQSARAGAVRRQALTRLKS